MQQLIVSVYPQLSEPGNAEKKIGVLDEDSYVLGPDTYSFVDGISYDITLANTGEAILLTGSAHAKATTRCARCLEPVSLDLSGEVDGYYFIEPDAIPEDDLDEDEYGYIGQDDTIDIAPAVLSALILEMPMMPLCAPDCLGLCPQCGKNLNEGPCSCASLDEDRSMSPFAALEGYVFEEPPSTEQ